MRLYLQVLLCMTVFYTNTAFLFATSKEEFETYYFSTKNKEMLTKEFDGISFFPNSVDYGCITKYPEKIEFNSHEQRTMNQGIRITIPDSLEPLVVSINQNENEFLTALEKTGLFDKEESKRKFKRANWTRVYSLNKELGLGIIRHTPRYIQIGGDKTQYTAISKTLNSFPLKESLRLSIFQTEEEFTESLIKSGIYDLELESKITENSWTKSFMTFLGVSISRYPTYIQMKDYVFTATGDDFKINGIKLPAPLLLNLQQTEEEFEKALIKSGIMMPSDPILFLCELLEKLKQDENLN